MAKNINRDIQLLSFEEARPMLKKAVPDLCHEIDLLEVDDSYKILKMRYDYGDFILDKGKFFVPDGKGGLVFKDSQECDKTVRDLLSYQSSMPMVVPIKNALEVFVDHSQRPIPFVLAREGHILGLPPILEPSSRLDPPVCWTVCAGARVAMMLPKIAHNTHHARLCKKLSIKTPCPDGVYEHFNVFKAINRADATRSWTVEVLVFTGKWFADRTSQPWRLFREYLFKVLWNSHAYRMVDEIYGILLSEITRKFKVSPEIFSTLEYIVNISQGKKLGHILAVNDHTLPLSSIQNAYREHYQLKEFDPEIIHSGYLSDQGEAFYSLMHPNRSDFFRANNGYLPKLSELSKLLDLINYLKEYLSHDDRGELSVLQMIKTLHYQGIHFQANLDENIISTATLAEQYAKSKKAKRFPLHASYFCGAVKISTPLK